MKKTQLSLLLAVAFSQVAVAHATTYVYQKAQPQLKLAPVGGLPPGPTVPPAPARVPKVQLSTSALDFGGVDLGGQATQSVLISNIGTAALTLGTPVAEGTDFSAVTDCPASLAQDTSCLANITFTPGALGERAGQLRLPSTSTDSPAIVSLQGIGQQGAGELRPTVSSDFGVVGLYQSQTREFTFTNTGNRHVRVTAALTGPDLTFVANGCGIVSNDVSIAPNTSCTMTVRYAPTTALPRMTGTLTVAGNFKDGPATLDLSGSAKELDPEIAKVVLLLHMDGNFQDSSPTAKAVTTVGSVRSTETPRFGTGALGLGDTVSGLKVSGNADFAFAPGVDFTIEAHVKSTAAATYKQIVGQWGSCANSYQLSLYSGKLGWERPGMGTFSSSDNSAAVSLNSWHHVAVSRQGSTISLYLDGNRVATASDNVNYTFGGCGLGIGKVAEQNGYGFSNGAIDDVRVTRGLARYTGATITVPTAAFPH